MTVVPQITLGGILRTNLPAAMMSNPGNAGEWAQYQYRGYGFRLMLMAGPNQGQCQVLLDGAPVQTVDCYAALVGGAQPAPFVLTRQNLSLDFHRVKVIALGTKNAASGGTAIGWYSLQVMR